MSAPTPVLAKKTISATIGGIASRAPTNSSTTVKKTIVKKTTSTASAKKPTTSSTAKKLTISAAAKKPAAPASAKKPEKGAAVQTATGRPQRKAATNFLNELSTHRKALHEYRSAMAVYKENVAKGVAAKKPKEPEVPQQFKDALRSEETEDEEEETDEEFQEDDDEEDDESFDEDDDEDDE